MISPLKLAVLFHDTYERLAPDYGYETKEDTRVFKAHTPNGKLMVAVCREIHSKFRQRRLKLPEIPNTHDCECYCELCHQEAGFKKAIDKVIELNGEK